MWARVTKDGPGAQTRRPRLRPRVDPRRRAFGRCVPARGAAAGREGFCGVVRALRRRRWRRAMLRGRARARPHPRARQPRRVHLSRGPRSCATPATWRSPSGCGRPCAARRSTSMSCASTAARPSGARRQTRPTLACCRRRSATRATAPSPSTRTGMTCGRCEACATRQDLARRLGHPAEARSFAASRDTFTADLSRSVRAAMAAHSHRLRARLRRPGRFRCDPRRPSRSIRSRRKACCRPARSSARSSATGDSFSRGATSGQVWGRVYAV